MKSVESEIFVKMITATDLNKVRKMYMDEITLTPENSEWLFEGAFGKNYNYKCVGFDYEFPGVGKHFRVYIELQEFKEKTMKHPNYEFIVACAEGKEVEFKVKGLDGAWDKWHPVKNFSPFSNPESYIFRFKPEKKKTVGYRRYVWKESYGDFLVELAHSCFEDIENEDFLSNGLILKFNMRSLKSERLAFQNRVCYYGGCCIGVRMLHLQHV